MLHVAPYWGKKFQFQSGAVKRQIGQNSLTIEALFQFQSGAVKRPLAIGFHTEYDIFQFQSGAVKS